jgi:hypothetical protein
LLNYCVDSFEAFLEAFIILIALEVELVQGKEIANPPAILDDAVAAAGGEAYRAFYQFIFPIRIEGVLR